MYSAGSTTAPSQFDWKLEGSYFMGHIVFKLSTIIWVISVKKKIARRYFCFLPLLICIFFFSPLTLKSWYLLGMSAKITFIIWDHCPLFFTHISHNSHWKPNSGVIWTNSWETIADTSIKKMFLLKSMKRPLALTDYVFIFCRHQFSQARKQEMLLEGSEVLTLRHSSLCGPNLKSKSLLELEGDIYVGM